MIAGSAFGLRSPVVTASDTIFVDVTMEAGSSNARFEADYEKRAIYIVDGEIEIARRQVLGTTIAGLSAPAIHLTVRAAPKAHIA